MYRSLSRLTGHHLGAIDGDIGHVKDFYFEDQTWIVRYVIADTGSWLTGRQVLLHPNAFPTLEQTDKRLLVNLTRKQIEDSPLIGTDEPVSRQFEETYFEHYLHFRPYYWENDDMWAERAIPASAVPEVSGQADPHLRSTQAMLGYRIDGSDGDIGHAVDLLMDDEDWAIRLIVIRIGGKLSGHDIQIPTRLVAGIDFASSTMSIPLTRESVMQNPRYQLAVTGSGEG